MRFQQQGKVLYKMLGVVAGLVFAAYGVQQRSELGRIKKSGKIAVVDPIANYTEFSQSGSKTYTAEFHYAIEGGQQMVVKHSFPEEVLDDFKTGRPVEIVYQGNDPSTFVFAKEEPSWTLVIIGVAVALGALIFA